MKIDYITAHDPTNTKTWSGLNYFIMKALEKQGATINIITNLHAVPNFGLKWRYHFYKFFGKNYQYERTDCYTKQFGEQVNKQLSNDADIVFSTTSSALAYINTDKPVILYTDATFDNLAEYYDHFSRLPLSSKKMGDKVELLAYNNCAALIFSSAWAAKSVIDFYGADRNKVHVIPFGANLLTVPGATDIQQHIHHKNMEALELLWAGVEYKRKGGPLAIAIAAELNKKGVNTRITLLGVSTSDTGPLPAFASAAGFLEKSAVADAEKINALFEKAHFFILPTTMDCTPVVFSEAAAFGLPILSYDISGISDIIKNSLNGFVFEPGDSIEKWVSAIITSIKPGKYSALALNARKEYDERLNWDAAGKNIFEIAAAIKPISER